MRYPKRCQIYKATANTSRGPLSFAHVERGRLIATNGRLMVSVPLEGPLPDENLLVSSDALKSEEERSKDEWVHLVSPNEWPNAANLLVSARARRDDTVIALSGNLLRDLLDALGAHGRDGGVVRFGIPADGDAPVYVQSHHAEGLIMPAPTADDEDWVGRGQREGLR